MGASEVLWEHKCMNYGNRELMANINFTSQRRNWTWNEEAQRKHRGAFKNFIYRELELGTNHNTSFMPPQACPGPGAC